MPPDSHHASAQQAARAKAIQEAAAKRQAERTSVAKSVDVARHPMDDKSEAARRTFNAAAGNASAASSQTGRASQSGENQGQADRQAAARAKNIDGAKNKSVGPNQSHGNTPKHGPRR